MLCKKSLKRYFCRILAYLSFFLLCVIFLKEYFIGILVYLLFDREPHILVSKHSWFVGDRWVLYIDSARSVLSALMYVRTKCGRKIVY